MNVPRLPDTAATRAHADFEAICALLGEYFDGLHHGDTARLRRVFLPQAQYLCVRDGALTCLAMAPYFEIVDRRPAPASRDEPREDLIRSIDFAGPSAAVARVRCRIGTRRFDDILSLLKLDGRWRIAAKVFDECDIPATTCT